MDYTGRWIFDSIGIRDDDMNLIYVNAEEYLKSPLPAYIDANDEFEVASEIRERKAMIAVVLDVKPDGKVYIYTAIPEDATQEQIDAAIAAGEITIVDGMIGGDSSDWEDRNGEMWINSGIEGEAFGEATDPWIKVSSDDGYLDYMNIRFKKA